MTAFNSSISMCRLCQYYKPMGRRGGSCEILNVAVQGTWKSCHLATPAFSAYCKSYEIYASCSLVTHS